MSLLADIAHPLGAFHGEPHLASRLTLLGTAAFAAVLGRLQLAWRALEPSRWWASNGRDILLLFSVCALAVALVGLGFPPAAAFLAAAQVTLLEVGVESLALAHPFARAPNAVAIIAAVVVTVPLALAPREGFALLDQAVRALVG